MRVLQINAVYGCGSTGRMVKELHEYLKKKKIESYVACFQGCDDSKPDEFVIGNTHDVKIHSIMARVTGLQGYYSNKATMQLLDFIDKIKPDIVHIGNLHSNYVNVIKLLNYLAEKDIATVITLHDCWFYTGKCSHYTVDGCYKWKTSCGDCPRLKKDIPSWFFDKTPKMLTDKEKCYRKIRRLAVIGVSEWITKEAKQSILKEASILKTIHNWIDLEVFQYKKAEANQYRKQMGLQGKFIILGVSYIWSDVKGLSIFYELANHLKEDEVIVLVGKLESQGMPSNIIHIPPTKNAGELAIYYSMSDVFLQMSPEESFGKVVAEAMACGTPVITVNSTANAELVSENTGFILPIGDIQGIHECINKIKQQGNNTYAEICQNHAKENFNIIKQLEKYIEVYSFLQDF